MSTKEVKRIPLQAVQVVRNGKLFSPAIGKPFEFTKDEVDQIKERSPQALQVPGEDEAVIVADITPGSDKVIDPSGTTRTQVTQAKIDEKVAEAEAQAAAEAKVKAGKTAAKKSEDL